MLEDLPNAVLERIWSLYFKHYAGNLTPEDVLSFILVKKEWKSFALEERNDERVWKPVAFALCPQCLPHDRRSLKYGGSNQTWFETCKMCRCWDRAFAKTEEGSFREPKRKINVRVSKELPHALKSVLMVCDANHSSRRTCYVSMPRLHKNYSYPPSVDVIQVAWQHWRGEGIERLSWARDDENHQGIRLHTLEGPFFCSETDAYGYPLEHFFTEGHWNWPSPGYHRLRQLEDGSFHNEAYSDHVDPSQRIRYHVQRIDGCGPDSLVDPEGNVIPEATKWYLGEAEGEGENRDKFDGSFAGFGDYLVQEITHTEFDPSHSFLRCFKAGDSMNRSRRVWDKEIDGFVRNVVLNGQVAAAYVHKFTSHFSHLLSSLVVVDLETGVTLRVIPVLDCPANEDIGGTPAQFCMSRPWLTDTHVMLRYDGTFHAWNMGTGRKTTLPNPSKDVRKRFMNVPTVEIGPKQSCSHLMMHSNDNRCTCWNFLTGEIEFVADVPLYDMAAVYKKEKPLTIGLGFFLWYELDPEREHHKYHLVPAEDVKLGDTVDLGQPVERERVRDPAAELEEVQYGNGLMYLELEDPDYAFVKEEVEFTDQLLRERDES